MTSIQTPVEKPTDNKKPANLLPITEKSDRISLTPAIMTSLDPGVHVCRSTSIVYTGTNDTSHRHHTRSHETYIDQISPLSLTMEPFTRRTQNEIITLTIHTHRTDTTFNPKTIPPEKEIP